MSCRKHSVKPLRESVWVTGYALVLLTLSTTVCGKHTWTTEALTLLLKILSFSDMLAMSCRSLHSSSVEPRGLFSACWVLLPFILSPCCVLHSPVAVSLSHFSMQPGDPRLETSLTSLQLPSPSFKSLLQRQLLSVGPRCEAAQGDKGASVWLCFLVQSGSCSFSLSSLSLASQSMELSESVADILSCRV